MGEYRCTVPVIECLSRHGIDTAPRGRWQGCETYYIAIPASAMPALDADGVRLVHCWHPPGSGCPALRMASEPPYPDESR